MFPTERSMLFEIALVMLTESSGRLVPRCYEPGKKIYWELARYSGVDHYGYLVDFQQLWQGGMINFRDRYYIEQ